MSQNIKTITEKKLGRSKYLNWVLFKVIFNTIKNIFQGFFLFLKFLWIFSEKSTMIGKKIIRPKYPYPEARTVFFQYQI